MEGHGDTSTMTLGYVIGNGKSRLGIPKEFYEDKLTWGCKLAFLDLSFTHIVACDRHIITRAVSENAFLKSNLWTRKRWITEVTASCVNALPEIQFPQRVKFDGDMHWGSGTHAAHLACLSECEVLVFLGFDLWGDRGKINNVFAGEKGYGPADADPVGPEAWIHQFGVLFDNFVDKQFVFVNNKGWEPPESWLTRENFFVDDFSQL